MTSQLPARLTLPLAATPATVQDIATGNTITVPSSFNKRLTVNGAGATGVILAAGVIDGQILNLINADTTDSITFHATAATSNVAGGASVILPALGSMQLVWDATSARWYVPDTVNTSTAQTITGAKTFTAPVPIAPTTDTVGLTITQSTNMPAGVAVSAQGTLLNGAPTWQLGNVPGYAQGGALTLGNQTPSATVFTILADTITAYLRGGTTVYLRTGTTDILTGTISSATFSVPIIVPAANGAQNKIGTATTADALADTLIATSATTQKGLVIQGKASQSAPFLQVQNSAGASVFTIQSNGQVVAGSINPTTLLLNSAQDAGLRGSADVLKILGRTGAGYVESGATGIDLGASGRINGNAVAATASTTTGARTASATATFTTPVVHYLIVGQIVVVSGASVATYNGTWIVATLPSGTTFTAVTATNTTDTCTGALVTAQAVVQLGAAVTGPQTAALADVQFGGSVGFNRTITAAGTTGDRTINKMAGRVNLAAATATLTVTNSLCTVDSIVVATLGTADATATFIKSVVPGNGSFVVTTNANTTAETAINWVLFN